MREIVIGTILTAACAFAQPRQTLLLPEARHIIGVVVDERGMPVPEARIDHTNDRPYAHKTGADGKFDLDTVAPMIVIRKAGFRSQLILTQAESEIRVVLRKIEARQVFPVCSNAERYDAIEGWGASFRFPRIDGIKKAQGRDADYAARSWYVETDQGAKGIRYGVGPIWDFGMPSDSDVWQSVKYEEIAFADGVQTILDGRGQLSNGNRWRYLGKFGESARYSNVDEPTANVLDKVLDGVCLSPAPFIRPLP